MRVSMGQKSFKFNLCHRLYLNYLFQPLLDELVIRPSNTYSNKSIEAP